MENTPVSINSSSSSGKKLLPFIIALLIILALAAAVFAYQNFMPQSGSDQNQSSEEDESGNNVTSTPTATSTPSPTEEESQVPAGWEPVANTQCGYTAYRPAGWYYRMFTGCMLGLDPYPIPTQSEYAGAIVIQRFSGTVASQVAALKGDLEPGATEVEVTVNGRSWTIVEGTLPGGEIFDAQQVKAAFTSANGATYRVSSYLVPATFAQYEDELDKEIEVIEFN